MRRATLLTVLLLVPLEARAGTFVKGPWLQNVDRDGITVMWESSESEMIVPSVEYGLTTGYELGSVGATYEAVEGRHVYTVRLSGLAIDTIHHYRVVMGSTVSVDATFKTAPLAGTSGFRFYLVGDNRSNPGVWGAISALIHSDMEEYPAHHQTFVLDAGDVVGDGSVYSSWDELWPPARSMASELPIYVALGNHEDRLTTSSDAFIYGYFDFPFADSLSTDEKWYSFRFGNAHFAAIAIYDDAGYTSGVQYDWLRSDLHSADLDPLTDWTFAILHFLPWSLGSHDYTEAANLQTYIHPVLRDENVGCALGGHNHAYARYEPVDGVTYVTSGGAGAPLSGATYPAWPGGTLAFYSNVYEFCVVDVEGDVVALRAVDLVGDVIDWVTLGGTDLDRPPFADAGPDLISTLGSSVTLDARGSADPEGATLDYEWSQVSGTTVVLSDDTDPQPTFTPTVHGRYLFQLRVSDGTRWSAPDFVLASVIAGAATFTPVADAYVNSLYSTTNYGTDASLNIDTSPEVMHSYLRFDVSGTVGEIESASLRLYCTNWGNPGVVYTSSDTSWIETDVTWSSPVPADGPLVGYLPSTAVDTWASVDVTGAVRGDGPITFVILPTGTDGADFRSRESPSPPELVVAYLGEEPLPPTCSFAVDPSEIFVGDTITFTATATDPDGGSITGYEWDYDHDGSTFTVDDTGDIVNHSYDSPGGRTVALRVTDEEFQTCLDTEIVTVLPIPVEEEPEPDVEPDGEDVSVDVAADESADVPADTADDVGGRAGSGCGCTLAR